MTKIKKHTIEFETDYDYEMIGICSHHSDYRIVWEINDQLEFQLFKNTELFKIWNTKGELQSEHPYYLFNDIENYTSFFLITNKQNNEFLIPEKKQIDYFIFILNNQIYRLQQIIDKIKNLNTIIAAYSFEPVEINSTKHLVFDQAFKKQSSKDFNPQ
jgi:hypothetical protein